MSCEAIVLALEIDEGHRIVPDFDVHHLARAQFVGFSDLVPFKSQSLGLWTSIADAIQLAKAHAYKPSSAGGTP